MTLPPTVTSHRTLRHSVRHWARSVVFTLVLTALVAGATDASWQVAVAGVTLSAASLGAFSLMFSGGLHFGLTLANFLAVYGCMFAYFREANFSATHLVATIVALILPVSAFLARCFIGRRRVAGMIHARRQHELTHLPRLARWVPGVAVVGCASFALPPMNLPPDWQDGALIASMAIIGGFVALAQRDVLLLMMDVTMVFEEMAERIDRMVMPVMAFVTFYSLLVVVFACLYRVAERSLGIPQFLVHARPAALSFPDALYFSVITISTVGYGDIAPNTPLVRTLAALEVVCGLLMLLFGFAEIMRSGGPESERRRGIRAKTGQNEG
jgi:voltage-gated potassium channel